MYFSWAKTSTFCYCNFLIFQRYKFNIDYLLQCLLVANILCSPILSVTVNGKVCQQISTAIPPVSQHFRC